MRIFLNINNIRREQTSRRDVSFRSMLSKKSYSLCVYYNEPGRTWRGVFRSLDQSGNTWERVPLEEKSLGAPLPSLPLSIEVQLHGTCV